MKGTWMVAAAALAAACSDSNNFAGRANVSASQGKTASGEANPLPLPEEPGPTASPTAVTTLPPSEPATQPTLQPTLTPSPRPTTIPVPNPTLPPIDLPTPAPTASPTPSPLDKRIDACGDRDHAVTADDINRANALGPSSDYEVYLGYAFTGTKIVVARNTCHKFDVNGADFNDKVRSVRVPAGGTITIWEHPGPIGGKDPSMALPTSIFIPLWGPGWEPAVQTGSCARVTRICAGP